jgi:hypothetical protein
MPDNQVASYGPELYNQVKAIKDPLLAMSAQYTKEMAPSVQIWRALNQEMPKVNYFCCFLPF